MAGDILVDYSELGYGTVQVGAGDDGDAAPPPTTTTAPPPPAILDVSIKIDPDTGVDPIPHSIQASTDAKITLSWTTKNASGVRINPLGTFDASGSTELPASDADYTIVALADDGTESVGYPLEVHTHGPDEMVSQHANLDDGGGNWVSSAGIVL